MCRTVTVTLIVRIMLEISRACLWPMRGGSLRAFWAWALAIRPADEGASLRELLDRMGHTSTRATLIYLHSFDERQRVEGRYAQRVSLPVRRSAGVPGCPGSDRKFPVLTGRSGTQGHGGLFVRNLAAPVGVW